MAATKNNEELKRQAINTLAEGRTEISAEVQRLRMQISPMHALRWVVDRHTGVTVLIALAAGIVPVLLIFGRKRAARPLTINMGKPPPKPLVGALLMGAAGLLAKSVTPAMVRSAIVSPLLNFLARKQADAAQRRAETPRDL